MADYECHPLWRAVAVPTNVDPASLDIPSDLAAALTAWGDEFTATLNRSDPAASGFPDEPTARRWLREGSDLAAWLRTQGISVDYFHEGKAPVELVVGG